MILLNPGPANTTLTVKQAMARPDVCPREAEFGALLQSVCERLTQLVHSGDEYTTVLLGGSGSAAVEAAIASSVPQNGRLLVLDNGAYGARVAQIAEAYGIAHDRLMFGSAAALDLPRIAAQLETTQYTQLAVVHHETSTGMLNPVAEVATLCRAHGVQTIVDAMSSYAGMPIDIDALGADFLVASANKCLQGMAGLAFVICRRSCIAQMSQIPGRSYCLSLGQHYRALHERSQMLFTAPVQVVYALDQALIELEAEGGVPARHERYLANWRALDSGMQRLGFRRLLPEPTLSRILTAYLEPVHPRYSFAAMHDRLYAKGFTIYPAGIARTDPTGRPGTNPLAGSFRLANMGAIAPSDMADFVAALAETLGELAVHPLYADQVPDAP